jgi:hypothetical protein
MKHAYLIIAHHEFEVLKRLVKALDDNRNAVYIHFDKKITHLPVLTTDYAELYLLDNRVNVKWGDVSQIEAELVLFAESVKHGPYAYYHLLSGVDLPIKSQDFIHSFCGRQQGKEFIDFYPGDAGLEIDNKVQRYHLFPKYFRAAPGLLNFFRKGLRFIFLRMQSDFGVRRHEQTVFKKGLNWVSVTEAFVLYLLGKKEQILKDYQYTFCADEIFLQTICWHSPFLENVFESAHTGQGCLRMVSWQNNRLVDWQEQDFEVLMNSEALFARKFNSRHITFLDRLLNQIATDV